MYFVERNESGFQKFIKYFHNFIHDNSVHICKTSDLLFEQYKKMFKMLFEMSIHDYVTFTFFLRGRHTKLPGSLRISIEKTDIEIFFEEEMFRVSFDDETFCHKTSVSELNNWIEPLKNHIQMFLFIEKL